MDHPTKTADVRWTVWRGIIKIERRTFVIITTSLRPCINYMPRDPTYQLATIYKVERYCCKVVYGENILSQVGALTDQLDSLCDTRKSLINVFTQLYERLPVT